MTTVAPPAGDAGPSAGLVPPSVKSHRLRYAMVGLVLVGALGFLLFKGLDGALNFYVPADQAVQQKASLGDKTFNLEGVVEPGSVHGTSQGVDFVIGSGSVRVPVINTGSPPQLFKVDVPVIAVGHFDGNTFVSNQILVKHSSTYQPAYPAPKRVASKGTA
jgi:cytochrome c-type biogenesis protein CcmE